MRYFATIFAGDDESYVRLGDLGIDLVVGTASRKARSLEALLSTEEIGRLANLGYRVHVDQAEDRRSRAGEIISFPDWLETVR